MVVKASPQFLPRSLVSSLVCGAYFCLCLPPDVFVCLPRWSSVMFDEFLDIISSLPVAV